MTLELLPDVVINALVMAGIYSLIALGWVIIYRATHVLNFATGELLLLGSYLFYWLAETLQFPFFASLAGALVLTAAAAICIYYLLLRPMASQPVFAQVILTLGLAVILTSVLSMIWGAGTYSFQPPVKNVGIPLPGGAFVSRFGLITVVVAMMVFTGLLLFLRFSRAGIQMRAAAEKPLLASQNGINVYLVFALGWGIAAVALTLAGVSYAYSAVLSPANGHIGLRGLAPALIGGLDSIKGAIWGSIIVTLVESLAVIYLRGDAQDAAAFTVLLIMLAIRPHGLFGTPEVRRV